MRNYSCPSDGDSNLVMKKYILGTVPFLNSKPLVYPLEKNLIENNIEVRYYVPSLLSEKLQSRQVDMGLIPVAELLKNPDYSVFPGISISSYGVVDSVILKSLKDIGEIESVAVDRRSRSSTALLKIILEKFHNIEPRYLEKDIGDRFLDNVDAGMLIGDAGLRAKYNMPDGYRVYDLGELWTGATGLPFVYAVFAYYSDNGPGSDTAAIIESKNLGLTLIGEIVDQESGDLGISREICFDYLTSRITYDLGEKEIEAINTFGEFLLEFDADIKYFNKDFKIALP